MSTRAPDSLFGPTFDVCSAGVLWASLTIFAKAKRVPVIFSCWKSIQMVLDHRIIRISQLGLTARFSQGAFSRALWDTQSSRRTIQTGLLFFRSAHQRVSHPERHRFYVPVPDRGVAGRVGRAVYYSEQSGGAKLTI